MVFTRKLGSLNIQTSALGMGCWAIGGTAGSTNYGMIDDNESIKAIRRALDMGVTLLDTADCYGCGHSEKVVGKAVDGRRNEIIIATKFGNSFDEEKRDFTGARTDKEYIEKALEDSLRRLNTDYIDIYQLHLGGLKGPEVDAIIEMLENFVQSGKIRSYGWSTDDEENAKKFAPLKNCSAIQFQLNLFYDNPKLVQVCEEHDITGLIRGPLAMGVLTGKYNTGAQVAGDDLRSLNMEWVPYFKDGKLADVSEMFGFKKEIYFSKSFKSFFGVSPFQYVKYTKTLIATYAKQSLINRKSNPFFDRGISLVDLEDYTVAYVRNIGLLPNHRSKEIEASFIRLYSWASSRRLINNNTKIMGIVLDNPETLPLDKCRYDACISVPENTQPEKEFSIRKFFSGGSYVTYKFDTYNLNFCQIFFRIISYIYGFWLPRRGLLPCDKPCIKVYEKYNSCFDLYIPVKPY
jgi:aryl-alcohol dehydrogenase-like predicted oxidoreductase/DNA gyrase inhibitor GyrI